MIYRLTGTRKRFDDLGFRFMSKIQSVFYERIKEPKDIPVIINNFNRLRCLKHLISWLENSGMTNIHIIDNASTYQPLLSFYEKCKYKVYLLGRNVGFQALWQTPIFAKFQTDFYIYTDPDILPSENCPLDTVNYFLQLLQKYPQADKVGFGLLINDLPSHYPLKDKVIKWESKFWEHPLEPEVYQAPIDTTFALYKPNVKGGSELNAIRTGGNYVARHLDWYINPDNLSEEEKYYLEYSNKSSSWTSELLGKERNIRY